MKEKNDFCIQFPGVPQRIRIGKQKFSSQKKGKTEVFPFSGMDMDLFEFRFNHVVDDTSNLSRHLIKFSVVYHS